MRYYPVFLDIAGKPVIVIGGGKIAHQKMENLLKAGVKELLVVSQDTSAYGLDVKYAPGEWRGRQWKANLEELSRGLGELGAWVRLHYVYPYPHVDEVIPLMAEGKILPYLDVPFQHASPRILKLMKRPASGEDTTKRSRTLVVPSSSIVRTRGPRDSAETSTVAAVGQRATASSPPTTAATIHTRRFLSSRNIVTLGS